MAQIQRWLIGKYLSITITPLVPNASGVLIPGTAASMAGIADRAEGRMTPRKDEISPLDTGRENDVVIKERCEVTISEIHRISGSTLLTLASLYDYFQVVFLPVDPFGGSVKTFLFIGNRGDIDFSFNEGKNTIDLTLTMVDPAQANPLYG